MCVGISIPKVNAATITASFRDVLSNRRMTSFLLRNSRKTDSLPAAKSAEFLFRLVPPEAAFALLIPSNNEFSIG